MSTYYVASGDLQSMVEAPDVMTAAVKALQEETGKGKDLSLGVLFGISKDSAMFFHHKGVRGKADDEFILSPEVVRAAKLEEFYPVAELEAMMEAIMVQHEKAENAKLAKKVKKSNKGEP